MHKVSCLIHEDFKQFYLDTHLFKMENISTTKLFSSVCGKYFVKIWIQIKEILTVFTIFFNFTIFPSQSHNILWSNFYKTYLKRICNILVCSQKDKKCWAGTVGSTSSQKVAFMFPGFLCILRYKLK